MKTLFFQILFNIILCNLLSAQQFSLSTESGYGFNVFPTAFVDGDLFEDSQGNERLVLSQYTYGAGLHFGVTVYYHLHSNIRFGVNVSYLNGASFTRNVWGATKKIQAKMLRVSPLIHLTYTGNKYKIYSKHAIVFSRGKASHEWALLNKSPHIIYEYDGGFSIGFMSALGLEYTINSKMRCFVESMLYAQSYSFRKKETIFFERDGVNQLPLLSTSEKVIVYENKYVLPESGSNQDPNLPTQRLRRSFPFSSLGVNLGFVYIL